MATCKNCLHDNVCRLWRGQEQQDARCYAETENGECDYFAEESQFVKLPCKIGQDAWVIRSYKGIKQPQKGEISEMYFTQEMKLIIVVKYVGRGEYGKTVFSTKEEAEAAIAKRSKK